MKYALTMAAYQPAVVIIHSHLFTGTVNESICFGDSLFIKGAWRHSDGTFRDTVSAATPTAATL